MAKFFWFLFGVAAAAGAAAFFVLYVLPLLAGGHV